MIIINKKQNKGFIALFSVIIISFSLLLLTLTLNSSGLSGRFNIFNSESKERSGNLASACIENARLAKALSGSTTTGSAVIDGNTCHYIISGNTIDSCGVVNKAYTFYEVTLDTTKPNFPVTGFDELPYLSTICN